ncbi:PREDICTED: WAP four-disulfide core domain protein 10A-like [Galeopterus variegatus]|uniref:WAP four-disulfide core domain protein 10A-like n=1 Tax=Galeopterus variegatus TaxID=482537 RepID=A0ABM0SK21_GALVR|nr:PREDICTED: WAP four-disulfide core domain protein 10A-like [Galeopterus variegatus]
MLSKALILILLLSALLEVHAGTRSRSHRSTQRPELSLEVKVCEKRPNFYRCKYHCESHKDCQANNICCLTFCGNVCMSLL